HAPLHRAPLHLAHLAAFELREARVGEVERDGDARHSVRCVPLVRDPAVRAEDEVLALELPVEPLDPRHDGRALEIEIEVAEAQCQQLVIRQPAPPAGGVRACGHRFGRRVALLCRLRAGTLKQRGEVCMKVQAAICWEPRRPLEIDDVDLAGPRSGECLVRLAASGGCHPDAYTMSGGDPSGLFPAVLGHEGAGVVEEVGPGVTSLAVGDHVIPLYIPECRQCRFCLSHRTNLCGALLETQGKGLMPDGTSRLSHKGRMLHHYMGTSTFAEYTVVPEIALAKIRNDAPLDTVCLLGCGITTGIGAVLNTARVEPGSSVVVFGLGGVGLSVIQGAVMAGAARIIGVDTNPRKFILARQLGATDTVDPGKVGDVVAAIVELTGGGADYTFECIGNVEVMG